MLEQYTVDANSPDYQAQLTSYLSRIEDKTVTHDARQAQKHLAGKEASLNYSRNNDQRLVALFEKQITQKADEIVNRKIRSDPVMTLDGRWDEKLEHYLSEVAKLLDGARMDVIPEGYTRKDIEEIQKIGDSHAIKLEAYAPSITSMRNMETTLAKALPTRTKNVGEKIQTHSKTQERKEISKEELSKSIKSASRASEPRKKEEGAEPVK